MSNRKQRREAERLEQKIKEKFTGVCEGFTSDYLNESLAGNIDEKRQLEILNKYDNSWRSFSNTIINSNPKFYNDAKKKTRLTSAFVTFVNNWYDKMNKPIGENPDKKGST